MAGPRKVNHQESHLSQSSHQYESGGGAHRNDSTIIYGRAQFIPSSSALGNPAESSGFTQTPPDQPTLRPEGGTSQMNYFQKGATFYTLTPSQGGGGPVIHEAGSNTSAPFAGHVSGGNYFGMPSQQTSTPILNPQPPYQGKRSEGIPMVTPVGIHTHLTPSMPVNVMPLQQVSWLAAFGTGGMSGEPPLLEELEINLSHIRTKTFAVLNPVRPIDKHIMDDTDLMGPLLFCLLFGISLLLNGKVQFGFIYGVALLGWFSIWGILNLMSEQGIDTLRTASVLGYCLLPMVFLSCLSFALPLQYLIWFYITNNARCVGAWLV